MDRCNLHPLLAQLHYQLSIRLNRRNILRRRWTLPRLLQQPLHCAQGWQRLFQQSLLLRPSPVAGHRFAMDACVPLHRTVALPLLQLPQDFSNVHCFFPLSWHFPSRFRCSESWEYAQAGGISPASSRPGSGENQWATLGENVWASLGENLWAIMGENVWASLGECTWASIARKMTQRSGDGGVGGGSSSALQVISRLGERAT